MTTETDLLPSSVSAFTEALWGDSGSLDAWLEVNDESEVAAHIEAYASACVSSATAEKDAEIDALRTRLEDTVRDSTNKIEALRAEVESVTCELMDATTRADKLAEALRLALNSHGKTLLTDPPQDAWKVNRVEEIGRALLRDQEEGHEQ